MYWEVFLITTFFYFFLTVGITICTYYEYDNFRYLANNRANNKPHKRTEFSTVNLNHILFGGSYNIILFLERMVNEFLGCNGTKSNFMTDFGSTKAFVIEPYNGPAIIYLAEKKSKSRNSVSTEKMFFITGLIHSLFFFSRSWEAISFLYIQPTQYTYL